MPRLNVIILERPDPGEPNLYNYVLWADVPEARQYFYGLRAGPSAQSAWKDATAQDNQNLQYGVVVEQVSTLRVPEGSTVQGIQAHLQTLWTAFQDAVNATGAGNPWQRYGTTWNGTTWVNGGVS